MGKRRNYSSVFNALARIYKEEGLTTHSQAKQVILDSGYIKDGIFCHFVASMISGLVTTIASMPVDIMKTRLQSMKYVDGVPEYKGAGDVLAKVIKNEGFFSLWKGFTPYYFRLGPHTVLTFIFLEQANMAYKKYILGIEGGSGGL